MVAKKKAENSKKRKSDITAGIEEYYKNKEKYDDMVQYAIGGTNDTKDYTKKSYKYNIDKEISDLEDVKGKPAEKVAYAFALRKARASLKKKQRVTTGKKVYNWENN